jgi:hypothetical protein
MDYLDKCRLCLEALKSRMIKITKEIQQDYYELTNTELIESPEYSTKVCKKCCNELKNSSLVKKKFLENQAKLKELMDGEVKPEVKIESEIQIKQEKDENLILFKCDSIFDMPVETDKAEAAKPPVVEVSAKPKVSENGEQQKKRKKKEASAKVATTIEPLPKKPRKRTQRKEYICDYCGRMITRRVSPPLLLITSSILKSSLIPV